MRESVNLTKASLEKPRMEKQGKVLLTQIKYCFGS